MNKKKIRFLVCVIFYNEQEKKINKTLNKLKKCNHDIILIDDGSDKSYLLKKNFEKKITEIISHKKNLGYGAAVKSAANYAKKKKYDFFCIFPGDNQRYYSDFNRMITIEKINPQLIFVSGSKFHLLKNIPIKRKIGNLFFSYLSLLWGNTCRDILSGFKIYNINKTYEIIKKSPDDFSFDVIFNILVNKLLLTASSKNKILETKVKCDYKNHSSKIKGLFFTFIVIIKNVILTFFLLLFFKKKYYFVK